jgi:ubiquitin carboxyl-terminal hydrolase 22/27/51
VAAALCTLYAGFLFRPLKCILYNRYTKPEKLGENQYSCGNCGHTFQAAVKQLSVKRLPQVLSFQLKRFEHGKSATKIETKIKFPIDLDMTPYTTGHNESSNKQSDRKVNGTPRLTQYQNSNLYTLFAVVNHQGKMDTGHYTMFAKHRGQVTIVFGGMVYPICTPSHNVLYFFFAVVQI